MCIRDRIGVILERAPLLIKAPLTEFPKVAFVGEGNHGPVSYTHLDVYKRQLHVGSEIFPLVKTGGLADVLAALPPALIKRGLDVRVPVSYTHLDVYKRQNLM